MKIITMIMLFLACSREQPRQCHIVDAAAYVYQSGALMDAGGPVVEMALMLDSSEYAPDPKPVASGWIRGYVFLGMCHERSGPMPDMARKENHMWAIDLLPPLCRGYPPFDRETTIVNLEFVSLVDDYEFPNTMAYVKPRTAMTLRSVDWKPSIAMEIGLGKDVKWYGVVDVEKKNVFARRTPRIPD